MLYNLDWLLPGKEYPPKSERDRITRCCENQLLFSNEHFGEAKTPYHNVLYGECVARLSKSIEGFADAVCFPVILNYQRAVSVKTADLVCGECPIIMGKTSSENTELDYMRQLTDFDSKLYATVIDLSRYGDAIWRVFKSEDTDKGDFTLWEPMNWFPIVRNDGTYRETYQVLCAVINIGTEQTPIYRLNAQIHEVGKYTARVYEMDGSGATIGKLLEEKVINTGLSRNAVVHLRNLGTSGSVYGYDDYMPLDSLLSEILTRIGQISKILDKHATPAMSGPSSMLQRDPVTGEYYLKSGSYYSVGAGEVTPQYLTWDGQLSSAFNELDRLLQQLYMLSELGEALLGSMGASNGQAISGTAMRFKLTNPLSKARRVSNTLTLPTKRLLESLSELGYSRLDATSLSITWKDGLPDDPRETIEIAKLATGVNQVMPLEDAIIEYLGKTPETAAKWIKQIADEVAARAQLTQISTGDVGESAGAPKPNARSKSSGNSRNPMQP